MLSVAFFFIVMLNAVMLSVVMLGFMALIMLSLAHLSVIDAECTKYALYG